MCELCNIATFLSYIDMYKCYVYNLPVFQIFMSMWYSVCARIMWMFSVYLKHLLCYLICLLFALVNSFTVTNVIIIVKRSLLFVWDRALKISASSFRLLMSEVNLTWPEKVLAYAHCLRERQKQFYFESGKFMGWAKPRLGVDQEPF